MIDLINILPLWLYNLLGNLTFSILALLIAFGASSEINKGQSNLTFSPATKLDMSNYHQKNFKNF